MVNDPKQPIVGELSVDASDLTFLVDIEPGARLGMRVAQPGIEAVVAEITANWTVNGGDGVVPESTYRELVKAVDRIAMIDARLPAARKLVEMMEETRALYDDQRERIISAVANFAEGQAKALGDSHIAARYEKTRTYRSAAAKKGVRTRRRNEAQSADEAELAPDTDESPVSADPDQPAEPGDASGDLAAPLV